MAGLYVPLVLVPRYTTYTGNNTFTTIGMDVSDFEKAVVSFWRSSGIPTVALTIDFQESMDQQTWSSCAGGAFSDPGANTEVQFNVTLTKRWFRISLTLGNAASAITCWCIGFLMQRET